MLGDHAIANAKHVQRDVLWILAKAVVVERLLRGVVKRDDAARLELAQRVMVEESFAMLLPAVVRLNSIARDVAHLLEEAQVSANGFLLHELRGDRLSEHRAITRVGKRPSTNPARRAHSHRHLDARRCW